MITVQTTITDTSVLTEFSKPDDPLGDITLEFREASPDLWQIEIEGTIISVPRDAIATLHRALGHVLSLRKKSHHFAKGD